MSIRQNGKIIAGKMENKPHYIGEIFCGNYSANYIPDGAVPANGGEYLATQFPELWDNYLNCSPSKLQICSYTEFDADAKKIGSCINWAIDTVKKSFRVPLIGEGTFLESGNGEIHEAGLPNINVTTHKHTHNRGNMEIYGEVGPLDDGSAGLLKGSFHKLRNHSYDASSSGSGNGWDLGFNASRNWTGNTSEDSHTHTLTNNVLGKSTTVQPKSVGIKYYVQIANGSIDKSMIDWAKYMAGLETKVNKNGDETITGVKTFSYLSTGDSSLPFKIIQRNAKTFNRTTYSNIIINDENNNPVSIMGGIQTADNKGGFRILGWNGSGWHNILYARQNDYIACITESKYNSDGSWYRKYSDGWIEQGGVTTNLLANTLVRHNLLKPMKNTNYYANVSQDNYWSPGNWAVIQTIKRYTTYIEIGNIIEATLHGVWYVCGQCA